MAVRVLLALLLALAFAACGGDGEAEEASPPETQPAGEEPAPATEPEPDSESGGELRLGRPEVVAAGLEIPWAVAFLPDGGILVTERPGRLRVIEDGRLRDAPIAELGGVVHRGEGGLLGIELHPEFEENRLVYLYYTASDGNRVSRFTLSEDRSLGDEQVVLGGLPAAANHNGGAIAFGPDGLLYVAVGDAGQPSLAAEPSSPAGSILRITPDGAVPADNPFGDSPVWSAGHRNVQGLAWDDEGRLYVSEHGPSGEFGLCCRDEVNLVEGGGFHGWPNRAGGDETGESVQAPGEPVAPVATSGADTTWAPGGIALHQESRSLLLTNLAGRQLLRLTLEGADARAVAETETALDGFGRLRAVLRGPEGCFYVTTSNRDGRGEPAGEDDRVLRLCPD